MRALLSVSDKSGLVPFATALSAAGWELVSTGGTARVLLEAGLPVVGISDVTGFPEMLDGRVKTLHPEGARRHPRAAPSSGGPRGACRARHHPDRSGGREPVSVCAGGRRHRHFRSTHSIEEIDIGGPSLVRAAAKNFRDVLVVVEPSDYAAGARRGDVGAWGHSIVPFRPGAPRVRAHGGLRPDDRDDAGSGSGRRGARDFLRDPAPTIDKLPAIWTPRLTKIRDLRYGENPHQAGAWYAEEDAGFGGATVHQGKELSFTNLLDLDAAARIALEFDEPAAVVIKHTNPCGVATGENLADAYLRAREADPLSAFGGIVGLNRPIDAETARLLTATFIEAVIAPGISHPEVVLPILATKVNLRVVTATFTGLVHERDARSIMGGWLVQDRDRVPEANERWPGHDAARVVTRRGPTPDEWKALRFAWRVCAHVKSNTVIFTLPDVTLAVGAGQMSRVDAVKTAIMKAGDRLRGTVAASDAFFPFRDGLDSVAAAGATAVVQPGGSVRDAEVIAAADEHDLAMVFTGRRHFRH